MRAVGLCLTLFLAGQTPSETGGAATPAGIPPERLEKLSAAYLGTPYRLDPLGEAAPPDRDPLFTRAAVDCQTLVEQVMAEALAPAVGGLERAGRLVRYRGGRVRLEDRFHYCIPDWLENPWPARDVTRRLGGAAVRDGSRRLDLPALLASRGGASRGAPTPARTVRFAYLPRRRVAAVPNGVLHGLIAVWVTDRPGTIAGHVGFLFRRGAGVAFRHASSRRGKVVDEPLSAYLGRAPRSVTGLILLEPDVPQR
jgi:hypothetical protein